MNPNPPNPGSDAAIALGCICPMLDNNHGNGVNFRGKICFWYHEDCPVHKTPKSDITVEVTKDAQNTDDQRLGV